MPIEQKVKSQKPNSQDFSCGEHLPLAHGGSDSRCSAGRSEQQLRGFVHGFAQLQGEIGIWEEQAEPLVRPHEGAVLPTGSPGSSPHEHLCSPCGRLGAPVPAASRPPGITLAPSPLPHSQNSAFPLLLPGSRLIAAQEPARADAEVLFCPRVAQ